ncbi:MAG TPA: cysteine peptidase family C39 domain-containing protein, partial [Candidatus Binatia bacterium]|nr:cysteine peptidase family C39 domain-containing protein [Candidatus Binatia bacterium]
NSLCNTLRVLDSLLACALLSGQLAAATAEEKPPVEQVAKAPELSFASQAGLKPIGDWAVDPAETQELNDKFAAARSASASVQPGPDAGAQRRAIEAELNNELESFLTNHTNSAYGPSVRLFLARVYQLRSGYSQAMDHYRLVWGAVKGSPDATAEGMARETVGGLAKLLALTGRLEELNALEAETRRLYGNVLSSSDWTWAMGMRAWATRHPTEGYKCGLYCLDQLGRLTQYEQFRPKDITETESSPNGFTAADLAQIGTRVGLRVRAGLLSDPAKLPVPCIVHLRSEHFVVLREQRGAFYNVYDPVAFGPRWLTAGEIAREATGCVLVDDAATSAASFSLKPLDMASAAAFRGRCHGPHLSDHDDDPCIPDGTGSSPHAHGARPHPGGKPPVAKPSGGAGCSTCQGGARMENGIENTGAISSEDGRASLPGSPKWFVTEPSVNLWVTDTPLQYAPAYGPPVWVVLAYNDHRVANVASGAGWHGAKLGNEANFYYGWTWTCS